jgi:DNA-binding HxlR family transcriptional regulator
VHPCRYPSPLKTEDIFSFSLIGDTLSLIILRNAFEGMSKFQDFRLTLKIHGTSLSLRLNRFVEQGIMLRQTYTNPGCRTRLEYILTDSGRDLRLPVLAMIQWASLWSNNPKSKKIALVNKEDSLPVYIRFIDNNNREINIDKITYSL